MVRKKRYRLDPSLIQKILQNTMTERIPSDNLLVEYFARPTDYDIIFNNIPAVIDGVRGTGKSMFLRFFQIEEINKLSSNQSSKTNILPIYFKTDEHVFGFIQPKYFNNNDIFVELFRSYFVIVTMEFFLNTLRSKIRSDLVNKILSGELRNNLIKLFVRCEIAPSSANNACKSLATLSKFFVDHRESLLIELKSKRLNEKPFDKTKPFFDDFHFIFEIVNILRDFLFKNPNLIVYILLDEYDKLTKDQQSVINPLIKERCNYLTFKVACKSGCFYNLSHPNQTIDIFDDIYWKTINRPAFRQKPSKFHDYLQDIVNKRLRKEYPKFSIQELLGESKSLKDKINQIKTTKGRGRPILTYFGAEDVLRVSSGVARFYMNLCNEILVEGLKNPDKPDFSENIQNDAIIKYSRIRLRYAFNSTLNGEEFFKLLSALSEVFRSRYRRNIRYPATLSFAVRDYVNLSRESKKLLKNAEREGIIFQFFRQGKDGFYNQITYGLNGVFAPAYNLIPTYPDAVQISSKKFDLIFTSQKDFLHSMKVPYDQQPLDPYFSGNNMEKP
ncbi:MAG: ORC-CDC6 family AAA ATPase [Candidatus Hodarchaeales archaeon]|jgi:hypothetical protein